MSALAVYDHEAVQHWLDFPGCIEAVHAAMAGFSADGRDQPLRSITPLGAGKVLALMPGFAASDIGFGAKLISVFQDPQRPGRSAHRGGVLLFDNDSGVPLCLADAHEVTRIRTGCASAVATRALAREDSRVLAIFGAGVQAESHVLALRHVRHFERVLVWGRSFDGAKAFAARMASETGLHIEAVKDAALAAAQADVICTTTGSRTPILLHSMVKPGTHINVAGSSGPGPVEIDSALVVASRYVADSRRSVLAAGAEFLDARAAGLIDDTHVVAEIGEVLLGRVPGRQNAQQITLYKSLGHVVQDLASAAYIHRKASQS